MRLNDTVVFNKYKFYCNKYFDFQLSTNIQSLSTILLYCLAFRLRISEHGPRSLSKLPLSSFTQTKLSLALTVAALGLK